MASTSSSFRATQWDPVLILSQIACLQSIWYVSVATIIYIFSGFSGADITLDAILNYREIRADNAQGMLLGLAWLLNSAVGVFLLLKIVSRARLVLDFSLTLLLYHVFMTTLYSDHVPTSFLWWALNGTTCGIMIFGGEYVCMQQEMEPILLGGGQPGSNSNGNSSNNASNSVGTSGNNNNSINSSNTNNNNGSSNMASNANEESSGLLMEVFDPTNSDLPTIATVGSSSRVAPQKARSSEDNGVLRGGFSPAIRSSILGNQKQGRQRTSDRYEMVPISDSDTR
ncbi:hypothetical protein BGZ70_007793 [Mortierella alpina]|uniref:Protein SYS1 n=1 Tax=Mortierella alpina TaxID=64518 RepID=A0A9P6M1N0_MORAP|nr:hypothetical protein BGZ70_007793 [Mortierella alpina]